MPDSFLMPAAVRTGLLLSIAEIEQLTGYARSAEQRRWLTKNRWVWELGGDNLPKVSRAYAEQRLGAVHSPTAPPELRL